MGTSVLILFGLSGVAATILTILLIADSVLWTREEDESFIDEGKQLHDRQEFIGRMDRLRIPAIVLTWASGAFMFLALSLWLFQGIRA